MCVCECLFVEQELCTVVHSFIHSYTQSTSRRKHRRARVKVNADALKVSMKFWKCFHWDDVLCLPSVSRCRRSTNCAAILLPTSSPTVGRSRCQCYCHILYAIFQVNHPTFNTYSNKVQSLKSLFLQLFSFHKTYIRTLSFARTLPTRSLPDNVREIVAFVCFSN